MKRSVLAVLTVLLAVGISGCADYGYGDTNGYDYGYNNAYPNYGYYPDYQGDNRRGYHNHRRGHHRHDHNDDDNYDARRHRDHDDDDDDGYRSNAWW